MKPLTLRFSLPILNPNGNVSLGEVIKLVKVAISENIPQSPVPCSRESFSKPLLIFFSGGGVGSETVSVTAAAVRLELSLLEWELDLFSGASGGVVGKTVESEEDEDFFGLLERLDFRQPPPTGTLRRTPPLVQ